MEVDRIRYEKWDAYTPAPHSDDRFTCDQGCLWSRIDGDLGHGAAPISWHTGVRVTHYVNPPFLERPQPAEPPQYGQGAVRGGRTLT